MPSFGPIWIRIDWILLICALLFLALPSAAPAKMLELTARPMPLDSDDPARNRIGRLVYRGGLELSSSSRHFGGLSGLLVSGNGTHMTVVSDQGRWMTARLLYDQAGRLSDVTDATLGSLRAPSGARLKGKDDQDAEALARLPDGALVVAFERSHRLWRYPAGPEPFGQSPLPLAVPPELASLRTNSGIEALATLDGGALVAIAEGRSDESMTPIFLRREGNWATLRLRRTGPFRPSGATELPGGDLLLIERSYNIIDGVAVRVSRLRAAALQPGATLDSAVIAVLRLPLNIDNLEGVAARQTASGETLVYMISDDNFRSLQRTLLLMFTLEE